MLQRHGHCRDMQHGSGQPVHRRGVHWRADQKRDRHQHGRQGSLAGQRVRRAAMAQVPGGRRPRLFARCPRHHKSYLHRTPAGNRYRDPVQRNAMLRTSITLPSLHPELLFRALRNIRQTTFGEYEVIVVSPFEVSAPNVIWVREEEPKGCACAHARAAEHATGDFLLAFADDHILVDGWDIAVAKDLIAFEKKLENKIGAIGLRFANANVMGTVFGKYYPNFPFMRREVVLQVGWIGNDYERGFGDCDLGMRIWDAGGWCEQSTRSLILIHADDARKSGANYSNADLALFVHRWGDKYGRGWDITHLRGFNIDIPVDDKNESDGSSESKLPGEMLLSYKGFNIFDHVDAFVALAQRIGSVNLNQSLKQLGSMYGNDEVLIGASTAGLVSRIDEIVLAAAREQIELLGSCGTYNLVAHGGRVLAIDQALGEVDVAQGPEALIARYGADHVIVAETAEGARAQLEARALARRLAALDAQSADLRAEVVKLDGAVAGLRETLSRAPLQRIKRWMSLQRPSR